MPGATPNPTSVVGQVNLTSKPKSTQANFRQMIGEVMQWNPDIPALIVKKWLNNAYRRVIDERLWYGLMVRGQVTVPNAYSTGTVTFTLNSPTVTGSGTGWDQTFVGRQIRSGFSTGWYNVKSVESAVSLTLDLPWGSPTVASAGYQAVQTWVTLGYNIKYVLAMVNQRQGYPLLVNIPQQVLNAHDTWRTTTGWTRMLANREPTADGQPQFELYPAPTFQQVFPFLAYIQAPDLDKDGDYPVTFVRSDIVVLPAIKDALLYRGKSSRYYDPQTAAIKEGEFKQEVDKLKSNDDNHYMKDLQWDFNRFPIGGSGSTWMQSHAEPWGESW